MGLPRSAWDEMLETVDSLDDERARIAGETEYPLGEAGEVREVSDGELERRRIERTAARVARLVRRGVRVLLEFQASRRRA